MCVSILCVLCVNCENISGCLMLYGHKPLSIMVMCICACQGGIYLCNHTAVLVTAQKAPFLPSLSRANQLSKLVLNVVPPPPPPQMMVEGQHLHYLG